MERWTVQKLLNWITEFLTQKGVEAPRLSAELLLTHVLGLSRIELYTLFDRQVEAAKLETLRGLVKRCGEHEPVAYLVGRCEFYSLPLKITRDCLIPRPETELLVERAVEFLRKRPGAQEVLDLCTGSGCIAAAVAKNCNGCSIIATDICDKALATAALNLSALKLTERIRLLCGDLFDPIIAGLDAAKFDLIVSNPPYVSDAEFAKLDKNVRDYEPRRALYGGANGLDIYRRIADGVGEFLKADGAVMLEIGYAQGEAVRGLLDATGLFGQIQVEKDSAKNDRVVIAKRECESQKNGVAGAAPF
jgi:release factor glutamine methyltransferase